MIEPSGVVAVEDFGRLDIRVGRVVEVRRFPEGRYSTHVLMIDFGPGLGTRKSLARLAPNYDGSEVVGRLVLAVVNVPPRQIGKHQSEVLTLGVPDEGGTWSSSAPTTTFPSAAGSTDSPPRSRSTAAITRTAGDRDPVRRAVGRA